MAMQKPGQGAIVDIGDNAYLFPSQAGGQVTDCFILAHGGTPSGTKLKDYYFTVPAGCEVHFFSAGGMNNKLPGSGDPVGGFRAMCGSVGSPSLLDSRIDKHSTKKGGQDCRDYILAKGVGDHFDAAPDRNHYVLIAQELADMAANPHASLQWQPHYVSVRNRKAWGKSTNIWLSRTHFERPGLGCERGELLLRQLPQLPERDCSKKLYQLCRRSGRGSQSVIWIGVPHARMHGQRFCRWAGRGHFAPRPP